jgi:tricorn protease
VVDPTDDESEIRKLDWLDSNRAMVDRLSGGTVGYKRLSDFAELGSEDFIRQFCRPTDKQSLEIDVRGNQGLISALTEQVCAISQGGACAVRLPGVI